MIKNNYKIIIRSLVSQKFISFINIFGLAISIAVCLLISLFIYDETNYDTFEKEYKNVYRLESVSKSGNNLSRWAATPGPLNDLIKNSYPEIQYSTRLVNNEFAFIKIDDKKFKEPNFYYADSSLFDVLGIPLLKGDSKSALDNPNSIVLSEKMAIKFYGTTDILNKVLLLNNVPMKVSGVLHNSPSNTHLKIDILTSFATLRNKRASLFTNWQAYSFYTYVRVKTQVDVDYLEDKLSSSKIFRDVGISQQKGDFMLKFHAIKDIHLDGNVEKELSLNSSWVYIYIFASVGFLVLLLASINYINLQTFSSLNRSKEIGVRKTLGASKINLIYQFLSESVLTSLLSFVLGLLVAIILIPFFNSLTSKTLSLGSLLNPFFILTSVGVIFFIGIVAGLYPAFFLSSIEPGNIVKGYSNLKNTSKFSLGIKKSLIVVQCAISLILIISSIVVINQIDFMYNKPLGFKKENLIILPIRAISLDKVNVFRNELKKNSSIIDVSATSSVPGKRVQILGVKFNSIPEPIGMRSETIDRDYLKTMQMEILQGEDFSTIGQKDSVNGFIINETAVKQLGFKKPIGENIEVSLVDTVTKGQIIGVVKDFNYGSLHTQIEPLVFFIHSNWLKYIVIRYNGENFEQTKKEINDAWNKIFPEELFTYSVLDDDFKYLYKSESTLKDVIVLFTTFSIFIALLGLLGLMSLSSLIRKKEISIRKCLGANNSNIIFLLSKEYIVLIAISLLISIPISNYILRMWLNNYAYRIDITAYDFIKGGLIISILSLITLTIQGLKAAIENPVKNLGVTK